MAARPLERLEQALSGRYEIERELGEGGMATVYLASDMKHNRHVALKVLRPELSAVVGAERFLAEIETTANLRHPHILPLFDSGEADSFLYYVMPYVEGETLRHRIDRERQLPVEEAVRIATAVAHALHHAHQRGVIHRDIKPGNILIQGRRAGRRRLRRRARSRIGGRSAAHRDRRGILARRRGAVLSERRADVLGPDRNARRARSPRTGAPLRGELRRARS